MLLGLEDAAGGLDAEGLLRVVDLELPLGLTEDVPVVVHVDAGQVLDAEGSGNGLVDQAFLEEDLLHVGSVVDDLVVEPDHFELDHVGDALQSVVLGGQVVAREREDFFDGAFLFGVEGDLKIQSLIFLQVKLSWENGKVF